MLWRLNLTIVVISMALLLPSGSMGQSTFGSITGAVTDQSGAVVPGAQVQVINEGTGAIREVNITSAGVFNVPDLDLGTYRVHVTAKGFETFERGDLHLVANQIIDVHVQLAVGATTTVVQVTAASPVITTETNDISGSMLNQELDTLPLSARHGGASGIYGYALFNTGVAGTPGNSLPVIGGARLQSGSLPTVDGIAVMAYPQGAGPVQPSLMDIQELKMETSTAPAEFAVAGTMAVVTRGGSNEFHGGAFEDYNGNILNTRNFFSATVPFRVYNNFGAKIGGPIKKNKLFFFGDYEGSREAATDTIVESVPLPAWRIGNFSSLLPKTQLINPLTGAPFVNNQIPSTMISQVSQNIMNYIYPQPNTGAVGTLANNFEQNYPGQSGFTVFNMVDARVDYNVGNKDTVFARISWRKMPLTVPGYPPLYRDQARWGKSAVLSWSHSLSAAAVNEFRFGATYNRNYYVGDVNGLNLLKQFGITGISTGAEPTAPEFSITGLTAWNPDTYAIDYEDNAETTFELIDNLSWTHGRHFMKFGYDWVRDRLGGNNINSNVYGNYSFTGTYSGSGFADFLLGIPQTTLLAIPNPNRHIRGSTDAVFAQDQFRLTQALTLNYGIRWEILPPYTDTHGSIYTFNPATGSLVIADNGVVNPFFPTNIPVTTASKAGYPANLLYTLWTNFNPRIGFAYKLFGSDKTVIRGGYGIYENLVYQMFARSAMSGGPFAGSVTYHNSSLAATEAAGAPLFEFPSPFLSAGTTATQSVLGINPHIKAPYTQNWNLSLERQFGQWGLRMSYKGSRSTDLIWERNLNEPPPSTTPFSTSEYAFPLYSTIQYADSGGNEIYNALELAAQKRYGKNLTTNLGWTWAKGLTDTQDYSTYGGQLIQNQFNRAVEKTNDGLTLPNRFFAYAIYNLPVGQGQKLLSNAHGPLEQILGGWRTNWTVTWQSGLWFSPSFDGADPSNTNPSGGGLPDRIANGNLSSGRSVSHWFNAADFAIPGCPNYNPVCTNPANVGRFGNAAADTLSGPSLFDLDFGLAKDFRIRENMRLAFTMNVVNLPNHPNFGQPASDISATSTVGTISSQVAAVYGNVVFREIDFGLRLEF